jgi:C4-dicarboxylate-specific signal transduction histidine kinase
MYQQARLASMGEMIANIAHQWRQPLSELTILLYEMKKEFQDTKQEKNVLKHYKKSQNLIKKMSQTIDDFRNFFDPHKPKEYFRIKDVIDEAMYILKDTLKNENIDIQISADKNIKIFGFTNEFSHVLINILNNAKDAFYKLDKKDKTIQINIIESQKEIKINILDNATGIDKNKLDKVFEPYYTTKQNLQGTGLGLYIAKMIVEESMNGKLIVQNIVEGVCFTIVFQKEDIIDR